MNILITLLALATLLIVIYSAVVISSDRAFPGRAFFEHIAGDGLNVFGARTQPAPELAGQQVVVLEPLPDAPAAAKPHEDDSEQHKSSTSGAIVAINKEIADKESARTTDKAGS